MAATLMMMSLVCFLQLGGIMVFAAHGYNSHPLPQVQANGDTTWCIAKPSTLYAQLENIINYCCVETGLQCSVIQPGGACFLGYNNKVSDASVVMNLYYNEKGKFPVNCNFSDSGLTIYTDPSVGNCVYRAA
ncbi:hypothetical protein CASFOL_038899 [Castilleja foliolosa]|uniref:X8 domain-containing protein n=1 Tax=Castilleja foliolosa TaxID=1961234 RepID=A0ABD3BIQ8_9LAMI